MDGNRLPFRRGNITHAGIAENNVVRAGENDERRIYIGGFEADRLILN